MSMSLSWSQNQSDSIQKQPRSLIKRESESSFRSRILVNYSQGLIQMVDCGAVPARTSTTSAFALLGVGHLHLQGSFRSCVWWNICTSLRQAQSIIHILKIQDSFSFAFYSGFIDKIDHLESYIIFCFLIFLEILFQLVVEKDL